MKTRFIILATLLLAATQLIAQPTQFAWKIRCFSDSTKGQAKPYKVCATNQGYEMLGDWANSWDKISQSFSTIPMRLRLDAYGDTLGMDTLWNRNYNPKVYPNTSYRLGENFFNTINGSNTLAVGYGNEALSPTITHEGVYIVKFNPQGDTLWTKTHPTVGEAEDVCKMPHNGIALTYATGVMVGQTWVPNVAICRLDSAGNIVTQKEVVLSAHESPNSICRALDGGFWVGFNGGQQSGVMKLDSTGNLQNIWRANYGKWDSVQNLAYNIYATADSGFMYRGYLYVIDTIINGNAEGRSYSVIEKRNKDFTFSWRLQVPEIYPNQFVYTPDGGFAFTRFDPVSVPGFPDSALFNLHIYNAQGQLKNTVNINPYFAGQAPNSHIGLLINDLQALPDGGFLMAGQFEDDRGLHRTDAFVINPVLIRTDSLGRMVSLDAPIWDDATLRISPNPAAHQLQVWYSLDRQPENALVELRDMLGRCVRALSLSEMQSQWTWDISALPAGIYFCTLRDGTRPLASQKVVISR